VVPVEEQVHHDVPLLGGGDAAPHLQHHAGQQVVQHSNAVLALQNSAQCLVVCLSAVMQAHLRGSRLRASFIGITLPPLQRNLQCLGCLDVTFLLNQQGMQNKKWPILPFTLHQKASEWPFLKTYSPPPAAHHPRPMPPLTMHILFAVLHPHSSHCLSRRAPLSVGGGGAEARVLRFG